MGCSNRKSWSEWRSRHGVMGSTGNRAFDDYREETLKRLEEEARDFRDFVDRLKFAKDKEEFDRFMSERRSRSEGQVQPSAT